MNDWTGPMSIIYTHTKSNLFWECLGTKWDCIQEKSDIYCKKWWQFIDVFWLVVQDITETDDIMNS